jgi:hypothetical protein
MYGSTFDRPFDFLDLLGVCRVCQKKSALEQDLPTRWSLQTSGCHYLHDGL